MDEILLVSPLTTTLLFTGGNKKKRDVRMKTENTPVTYKCLEIHFEKKQRTEYLRPSHSASKRTYMTDTGYTQMIPMQFSEIGRLC